MAAVGSRHPWLEDLAASFPALLHRIAVRRDVDTEAAVVAGRPLRDVAALADLPMWARCIPPEAFGPQSPALPDGEAFARRMPNALPRPSRARTWLDAVEKAADWGDEDFVLWIAREVARAAGRVETDLVPLLGIFAWRSSRPEGPAVIRLRQPWSDELQFRTAVDRARDWLDAIQVAVTLGERGIDPWFEPAEVGGFAFVPVTTPEALLEEGEAMRNCVADYAAEISCDAERIWSIRKDGARIATLSVAFGEAPFPVISQLKGPKNGVAPPEVWFAARKWLDGQALAEKRRANWDAPLHRDLWIEIWKPYWRARGRIPPELPLIPTNDVISRLRWPGHRPRRRPRRRG